MISLPSFRIQSGFEFQILLRNEFQIFLRHARRKKTGICILLFSDVFRRDAVYCANRDKHYSGKSISMLPFLVEEREGGGGGRVEPRKYFSLDSGKSYPLQRRRTKEFSDIQKTRPDFFETIFLLFSSRPFFFKPGLFFPQSRFLIQSV